MVKNVELEQYTPSERWAKGTFTATIGCNDDGSEGPWKYESVATDGTRCYSQHAPTKGVVIGGPDDPGRVEHDKMRVAIDFQDGCLSACEKLKEV